MKNLSRQEKLIAALIGSVLLLICVIVAGGGALYISVNRLRAAESAELIPTASVGEAAVRSDIESEVELLSESEVPATNTPRPTLTVAPTETRLPPTFTAPAPQPTEHVLLRSTIILPHPNIHSTGAATNRTTN